MIVNQTGDEDPVKNLNDAEWESLRVRLRTRVGGTYSLVGYRGAAGEAGLTGRKSCGYRPTEPGDPAHVAGKVKGSKHLTGGPTWLYMKTDDLRAGVKDAKHER